MLVLLLSSALLSLLVSPTCAFVIGRPPCSSRRCQGQNGRRVFAASSDDEIVYDDFDFTVGGAGDEGSSVSGSATPLLQERLNQLVVSEKQKLQQISQNWRDGHWSVRGCSLDPGDAAFGESKVRVSALLALTDDAAGYETILVGRTDGSVCWLQLGSEYLATFTNQHVAKETSNDTIKVQEQLKRDGAASIAMPLSFGAMSGEEAAAALSDKASSNFDILGQVQASSAPILDMAIVEYGFSDDLILYVLSASPTDPVQWLLVREDGPVSSESYSIPVFDDVSQSSPIVAIQALGMGLALTVSQGGAVRAWNAERESSSLIKTLAIPLEDDDTVLSCNADDSFVYFGTARGIVLVYAIDSIMADSSTLLPLRIIPAFANGGVSSICVAGEGVMGKGRPTPTVALVTGSTLGEIKQWELLPRGVDSLEYWPKIANQKMPGKAHLLRQGPTRSISETTPDSAVLALRAVQDGVLVSATKDQLIIWDTVKGKPYCDMQGLDFDPKASCLVLSEQLLVTNGMRQYVCVHDFSIDPDIDIKDMIQPMDDEDE